MLTFELAWLLTFLLPCSAYHFYSLPTGNKFHLPLAQGTTKSAWIVLGLLHAESDSVLYVAGSRQHEGTVDSWYLPGKWYIGDLQILNSCNLLKLCTTLFSGYIGYFATIAAFFWLTVISYDLWMSFRDNYQVQRTRTKFRFLMYSLYAWGCSFILTIIVMIIDGSLDMDDDNQMSWMPGVAIYYCWINSELIQAASTKHVHIIHNCSWRLVWTVIFLWTDGNTAHFQYNHVHTYGKLIANPPPWAHASNWLIIHFWVHLCPFHWLFALLYINHQCVLQWIRILEVKKELDHMQGRDERQSQVESNRRT